MTDLSRELQVTKEVIREAGAEVLRLYASFAKIEDAPANISTEADRVSQELILQRLSKEFPADGLCGEESTPTLQAGKDGAPRLWIVDPIDGTRGFARKNGEFSIMIGLVIDHAVVLGAVYEPAIDRLTYAAKGQGCYVERAADAKPEKCSVTSTIDMAQAVLSMSRSQGVDGEREMLAAFGASRAIQTYSAGIKMAQVARGETDIYVGDYLTLHDWDICAGHILVEEAGGTVTRVDGTMLEYTGSGSATDGRGMLATNGPLHEAALSVLATGTIKFR